MSCWHRFEMLLVLINVARSEHVSNLCAYELGDKLYSIRLQHMIDRITVWSNITARSTNFPPYSVDNVCLVW